VVECNILTQSIPVNPCWLASPVKHWRTLLEQRFAVYMPLLMACRTFGLGEDASLLMMLIELVH